MYSNAVRLSVSVRNVEVGYHGHIGWTSSKVITRIIKETPKNSGGIGMGSGGVDVLNRQESLAIAREPRDVATVVFGLKFADNIPYKLNLTMKKTRGTCVRNIRA